MSEPYERTFCSRIHSIERRLDRKIGQYAYVVVEHEGYHQTFKVLGNGSEWTPGQRVDVILRAVHEAEAPKDGE